MIHVTRPVLPPPRRRPMLLLLLTVMIQDSTSQRPSKGLPVTADVLASAFHGEDARSLFTLARRARIAQDSSISSYDAKVKLRLSVRAAVGTIGPERLVYRHESAAHVQWQRNVGAHVEVTGARVAVPIIGAAKVDSNALADLLTNEAATPIPYYPGSESMWIGGGLAEVEVKERELINPLAVGAEAYYTYKLGDSLSIRLPQGEVIRVRELEVRPRTPKWNSIVGSLWLEVSTGHLVRAAYRLAAPGRAGVATSDSSGGKATVVAAAILNGMFSSSRAEISSVVVEYGLYERRFWLPRMQSVDGSVSMFFARVPVRFENAFSYESVNATNTLGVIAADSTKGDDLSIGKMPEGLDAAGRKAWRDSTQAWYTAALKARNDSIAAGLRTSAKQQCDTASTRVIVQKRSDGTVPVELRIPCDVSKLTHSADLPPSIFDDAEEIFGSADRQRLIDDALSMAAQSPFSLSALAMPRWQYGTSMTRYNRVEGFSTGLQAEAELGAGLTLRGIGRYGFSDHRGGGELSLARSNLRTTLRVNGYTRLVAANDWGSPLSFGSSTSALLFGRDEGFYYRAAGVELLQTRERGTRVELRLFSEIQRNAPQSTTFSLGGTLRSNMQSSALTSTGASVRILGTHGDDPRGLRVFTDARAEGAGGDSTYGRAALDVTLQHPVGNLFDMSLTLGGGTTVGGVPVQRRWYLGGTQTVRGQRADVAQSGNAYWLTRFEMARGMPAIRAALFGDLGWTGDRSMWNTGVRPMSGVGVGASAFDGLLRFDIARGIQPRKQTRVDLYLNVRF